MFLSGDWSRPIFSMARSDMKIVAAAPIRALSEMFARGNAGDQFYSLQATPHSGTDSTFCVKNVELLIEIR